MQKLPNQEYTAEFEEQVLERVKEGQGVGAAAKELGLVEQTLRNWVKAFDAGWHTQWRWRPESDRRGDGAVAAACGERTPRARG